MLQYMLVFCFVCLEEVQTSEAQMIIFNEKLTKMNQENREISEENHSLKQDLAKMKEAQTDANQKLLQMKEEETNLKKKNQELKQLIKEMLLSASEKYCDFSKRASAIS